MSGEITSASDSAQKFASTLNFAGVSEQQIKRLTASTQDYADKTVYDLNDIRNTTAQLAANGVPNYDKLAEAAGNLNAVAGGSADTFKSVAMVLTQTAGQGKLTTENWNQLSDAIPGASGKIQQALKEAGAYTGNFRDAMADGQITAQEFNDAIMPSASPTPPWKPPQRQHHRGSHRQPRSRVRQARRERARHANPPSPAA
ncbi:MAG: tape measure protein [Bifidobacterium sp.]